MAGGDEALGATVALAMVLHKACPASWTSGPDLLDS